TTMSLPRREAGSYNFLQSALAWRRPMKATRTFFLSFAATLLVISMSAASASAQVGGCGRPLHAQPTAADALFALKASVGSLECDLCVCDVNNSGEVTATDALEILRFAVG